MLTKQRQEQILKLLEEKGSITVTEVKELLHTSVSTVRRDITALDQEGKLVKVFGGAVAVEQKMVPYEYTVAQKSEQNREEKKCIAKYAASLIEPGDFVFLDAGTTTAYMLDYIEEPQVTFVTNGVVHAQRLAREGKKVLLVGGELKASTEAVIGSLAMRTLKECHFTKGFFGTNGVTKKAGCTTPDLNEAMVKNTAVKQCERAYVLCDSSKFDTVSPVTFAAFEEVEYITERMLPGYTKCDNIIVL